MKKNLLLFSALAAMVFTGCQSDEPVNNGGEEATTGEQYMAVRITTSGMGGSRNAEFDGFEGPAAGSGEGTVTAENIRFYFFNAQGEPFVMSLTGVEGTVSNTNMVKPTSIVSTNTDGPAGTIDAVLVLNGYKGNKPARVFCVANAHALNFESYANKPLASLLELNASVGATTWTTFTMTSSTYVDGGIKYWSDIADENIATSAEGAKAHPVDIYLERLAVKVRATGLNEYTVQARNTDGTLSDEQYIIRSLDGGGNAQDLTNQKLTVELTGWRILNTALNSYAIKNLDASWLTPATEPFPNWNDATKHRSYWAYSVCAGAEGTLDNNTEYNIKDASQFNLTNFDAANPKDNILYCYEYTRGEAESVTDRSSNTTAILVRGIVKLNGAAADLCEWGGDMYTTARLKKVIAETYNKDYGSNYTATDVKFSSKSSSTKPNRWVATVGNTMYTRFDNIAWWDNGQTSYLVNIDHQTVTTGIGDAAVTTHHFGVVRNHIYDYEFTNVVGLGVPGNDKENPDPLTETFLAARINVLNWHIVSNSVVLE